jgi:hypothetical protein
MVNLQGDFSGALSQCMRFHVDTPEHYLGVCVKLAGAAQFIKCFITNDLGKTLPADAPKRS